MARSQDITSSTSESAQPDTAAQTSRTPTQPPSVASSVSLADEKNPSRQTSASNSLVPSPLGSRDPSPIRRSRQPSTKPSFTRSRSRRNSTEASPTRQARSPLPQASRTLSAVRTPTLAPGPHDTSARGSAPQKPSVSPERARDSAHRWPISPRLRSPPPQLNTPSISQVQNRRGDQDTPTTRAPRAITTSPTPPDPSSMPESESEEIQLQSGLRTPAHGSTLETVQEVSLPNSPGVVTEAAMEQVKEKLASELATRTDGGYGADTKTLRARPALYAAESGSDTGSMNVEGKKTPVGAPAPPPLMSRQSSSMSMSTKTGKPKPEGSTQNMTVETETVVSVPNVALAPTGQQAGNGTLKKRPSAETIKPRKEKKKSSRKQAAVPPGAASSKAEIFEAKVANAVDEADDSDSEETFVYDSNPPDGPRRFHSRTPSATSMMSQADRTAMRSIHSVMESAGPPMAVRKNMKFANTLNNSGGESYTPEEDGKGTGRSNAGSGRGTGRYHHHVGRFGRANHPSLFDNESPFPSASRPKFQTANSRQSSQPPSPRHLHPRGANGKRPSIPMANSYDLDDTTGADDERTPLMFSNSGQRTYRTARRGRTPFSQRQLEAQSYRSGPSYLNRLAACLVVTMMILLVVTGAISFMFATSQPLTNIDLTGIHNVIASEPELMFDLTVQAHNPNIVVVAIDHANLEIFAKSIHAGTDSEWWKHPEGPPDDGDGLISEDGEVHITDDPPPDMPDDDAAPNMRLGTITEFDSPLTFEGSFFHKGMSSSTGGMRLQLPGNQTAGGSERWGRILKEEFDLVIKGIVKYSLPLSQKTRSASISGRTTVKPNSANDPSRKPNSTELVFGH